jgi:hypothetical protein
MERVGTGAQITEQQSSDGNQLVEEMKAIAGGAEYIGSL